MARRRNQLKQHRPKIKWSPVWGGSLEGMAKNMVRTNLWRVQPLYDYEDLMQDALLYFHICKQSYPYVVEPAHFTSLYRTALRNHIHDLARSRSVTLSGQCTDELVDIVTLAPARDHTAADEYEARVAAAPVEAHVLLRQLERKGRPRKHKQFASGKRETTTAYLRRVLGDELPECDVRAALQALIPS